jgi:CRP/FNR family transcriptional regulator
MKGTYMGDNVLKKLDEFFSQYPIKRYHKGQILIYANEDPSGIFYLESGRVRKYDVSPAGDEVVLNIFKTSVFFPISWALNHTPNHYFFEAATPIEVRRAPVVEVMRYLEANPDVIYGLLKQVHAGLENTQRRVVNLMAGDARSRLLFELIIETRRSGELQDDGSYVIGISLSELAQRAGLSRETISRELKRLIESKKLLKRRGRMLVIRDLHLLEELLEDRGLGQSTQ